MRLSGKHNYDIKVYPQQQVNKAISHCLFAELKSLYVMFANRIDDHPEQKYAVPVCCTHLKALLTLCISVCSFPMYCDFALKLSLGLSLSLSLPGLILRHINGTNELLNNNLHIYFHKHQCTIAPNK